MLVSKIDLKKGGENMLMSLLNVAWSWNEFFENTQGIDNQKDLLKQVFSIISIVLWVAMGIVGAVGAVYAVYLGVQLARADEQGKRDDAKKHLITVIIAIGVTIALVLVFNTFLPALISAFDVTKGVNIDGETGSSLITPFI